MPGLLVHFSMLCHGIQLEALFSVPRMRGCRKGERSGLQTVFLWSCHNLLIEREGYIRSHQHQRSTPSTQRYKKCLKGSFCGEGTITRLRNEVGALKGKLWTYLGHIVKLVCFHYQVMCYTILCGPLNCSRRGMLLTALLTNITASIEYMHIGLPPSDCRCQE